MEKEKATAGKQAATNEQFEGKQISDQFNRVYGAFFDEPRTMKEVDKLTGIMRENVCRYCGRLREQNMLYPIRKRLCRITKHRATEYTTDPAKAPKSDSQLNLF